MARPGIVTMRLEPGNQAVPFAAETLEGDRVSLGLLERGPLLLMFFRYASCPMCNLRLRDFARRYPALRDRGLQVVTFFHSSARSIRAHAGGQRYPFHIVADPEFSIYRAYGVETSWSRFVLSAFLPTFYVDWIRSMRYGFWGGVDSKMGTMPADVLIGQDGRVLRAHYGRDIGDHLPALELEDALDSAGVKGRG